MVAGLFLLAVVSVLPLFFTGFAAFVALRFLSGVATAVYDPAARGMVVEATDADERGEAFGFYGAFEIGGFAVGPAIGGIGARIIGGYTFPFILGRPVAGRHGRGLASLEPAPRRRVARVRARP